MSYRLAIAISGAVSLGSYEAGVMFEIIRAIGEHNSKVRNADKKIEIDVVTGASAGGMTAAILAQKLMFDADMLDDPVENHLYLPWVEMADVRGMLEMQHEDDPEKSILSSDFIKSIAEKYLLGRYDGTSPECKPHPAAAEGMRLGLAMSNLNGVNYRLPAFDGAELGSPKGEFTYTRFQDRMTTTVQASDDNRGFWRDIAVAARSSGAFPFAFRALYVRRDSAEEDYRDPDIQGSEFPQQAFTYTDGGVFNNSPLGMAKMLAEQIDVEPRDYERRFYLYVSPDRKTGTVNVSLNESNASMLALGKALGGAIFQQGRFQDWVTTAHYNELIDQFDDRAARLCKLMDGMDKAERDAMAGVADHLLQHIYADRKDGEPSREEDFDRLSKQFMVDTAAQALLAHKGDEAIKAWIMSVQVLEQSGRLGSKDKMHIYTVTASDDELAGDFDAAFAGFFDRRFRDFDYVQGRIKARTFLQGLKAMNGGHGHMPLTNFDFPDATPPTDSDLAKAKITDVNRGVRIALKDTLYDRAGRLLKQAGVAWVLRKPIMWFYINGQLKKYLKLG